MNNLIKKNDYLNFLRSKLKSRIDFLEKYTILISEYVREEDVMYLKTLALAEYTLENLKVAEDKVIEIEEHISNSLKSLTSSVRTFI